MNRLHFLPVVVHVQPDFRSELLSGDERPEDLDGAAGPPLASGQNGFQLADIRVNQPEQVVG